MTIIFSGEDVCRATTPTPIPAPYWAAFSPSSANLIGITLDESGLPADKEWLWVLFGNQLNTSDRNFSNPIASVYSGHQFGVWAG